MTETYPDRAFRSGLLKKISELRADVLSKDWSDDKMMRGGGIQYPYLSTDKILRTVAPLFSKHDIELVINYDQAEFNSDVGNLSAHWTVKLTVTLMDTESGESIDNTVYGEASDSLDKGLAKAQTYALKKWVTSFFLISDGIDTDVVVPSQPAFKKATDEEVKVIKMNIKSNEDVVAPLEVLKEAQEPVEEAPRKKKEVKKASEPAPEPKPSEEPVKTQKSAPVKEPAKEVPKPEFKANSTYVMSEPHKKAIDKIIYNWGEAAADGRKTKEDVEAMMAEFTAISNVPQTFSFIKKYSKV